MAYSEQTYIRAAYDDVWGYLTNKDLFVGWFSAPGQEFGSRPGDPVSFGQKGQPPVFQGVIRRFRKGEGLAWTFAFSFLEQREETLVEWDVQQKGAVVYVRVRHDCSDAPATRSIITDVGWAKNLARLKTLVETGNQMPWPED